MKLSLLLPIWAACIGLGVFAYLDQQMDYVKTNYELEERCGKHAEEYAKGDEAVWTNNDNRYIFFNHYNFKRHKCYYSARITLNPKSDQNDKTEDIRLLYDLNDHNQIGLFNSRGGDPPYNCKVLEATCDSEKGWADLLKPYMTE